MSLADNFRANMKRYMAENKIPMCQLSVKLGHQEDYIRFLLSKSDSLKLSTIEKLCHGLGVDPVAMLEEW